MLRASSTSSSEAAARERLRAFRPRASLAWCLGFLALLRLGLGVGHDAVARVPGGVDDADWRGAAVALAGDGPAPRVAIFGSSRIRDALPAAPLARALGLEPHEVVNASLTAATPWELLALLRQHPDLLRGSELVFTDTQLWQWNAALESWVPRPLFLRHASLRERLALPGTGPRARALADWVWPWISERRRIGQWVEGPRAQWPVPAPNYVERPPSFDPVPQARAHAADYRRSPLMEQAFAQLAVEVAARGARLVVVQPPIHGDYLAWLEAHADAALDDYRRALEELAGRGVELAIWEHPRSAGLPDAAFFDYGHLRPRAAVHFARVVAEEVGERAPALAAGATFGGRR